MPFDYKKEYRAFYQPPKVPEIIDVPEMQFVCVSGTGDPNEEGGAYQQALGVLYAVSYTLKMSPRAGHLMDGFSITSCRRWKASGSRTAFRVWITGARRISAGCP